jgi:hypothetical protein
MFNPFKEASHGCQEEEGREEDGQEEQEEEVVVKAAQGPAKVAGPAQFRPAAPIPDHRFPCSFSV